MSTSQTSQVNTCAGRSWASLATSSSMVSSSTRATRAEPGLSGISLDTNLASPNALKLLQQPVQLQQIVNNCLGLQGETENIRIKADKTAPRNFRQSYCGARSKPKLLRERTGSLQAHPGVKLQREQWYPI
ncbi:uncharacterized protein BO88DRAFT_400248 [Aspergillus vadensis CBS 113365]|uniref:Uncharacterized protein n=1 Tax=Aspergillus vadensis (strain CBS 113365 / IMI 142717 / IBT 24658) TaxID=1448311 RepID=A0A319BQA0_ASPVC|nr:hypothetical protein BO88DRAFT_400248 [Aspergillus vadensis CBS 113365]PYH74584.1 hypothetical protein BO88DRAFT_400248 [Aspergillus vadensis CBS 113365]